MRSKREDLDEKIVLLESTQEHLAEANARLAMLETKPESVGNYIYFIVLIVIWAYFKIAFRSQRQFALR